MNDYRVYGQTANGTYIDQTIVARTEKEAHREFKNLHRGENIDVTEVTLIHENVPATKQQERDTLEAIKKMVAELGPQSYLATAFEGCFQDAEDNISDDAAYSMKDRYESSERRLAEAQETIKQLKDEKAALTEELEHSEQTAQMLQKKILPADDMEELAKLITGKQAELAEEIKNAEQRIVESADEPMSAMFQNAVKDHRTAKAEMDRYTGLLTRLAERMEEAGA